MPPLTELAPVIVVLLFRRVRVGFDASRGDHVESVGSTGDSASIGGDAADDADEVRIFVMSSTPRLTRSRLLPGLFLLLAVSDELSSPNCCCWSPLPS